MAAVVCGFVCAIASRAGGHGGFAVGVGVIVCDGSNSYFVTAQETPDVLALARDYPARMPGLRLHCQTQSPGATLLHAALRRVFLNCGPALALAESLLAVSPGIEALPLAGALNDEWNLHLTAEDISAALLVGLFFGLAGALGALPVYALARRVAGIRAALVVTALYAMTPSLIWFSPAVDQLYPTLACCIALLIHTARRRGRAWQLALAGLLAGAGMFVNMGFTLMVIIGGLMVACRGLLQARAGRPWLGSTALRVAAYGAAVLAVLAFVRWGLGIDLGAILRVSTKIRMWQYTDLFVRPWLTWVALNPVEYAIGLGLSSLAVVGAALVLWRHLTPGAQVVLGTTILALVALDISGGMRAEGSRLLLFTMPLLVIGAGPVLRRMGLTSGLAPSLLAIAQGLYAVVGCQLFEVWGVWATAFR